MVAEAPVESGAEAVLVASPVVAAAESSIGPVSIFPDSSVVMPVGVAIVSRQDQQKRGRKEKYIYLMARKNHQ